MDIAIALPNTLRIKGTDVVEWARRAEKRWFSSPATIDRIVGPEPAAGSRIPTVPSVDEVDRLADVVL